MTGSDPEETQRQGLEVPHSSEWTGSGRHEGNGPHCSLRWSWSSVGPQWRQEPSKMTRTTLSNLLHVEAGKNQVNTGIWRLGLMQVNSNMWLRCKTVFIILKSCTHPWPPSPPHPPTTTSMWNVFLLSVAEPWLPVFIKPPVSLKCRRRRLKIKTRSHELWTY